MKNSNTNTAELVNKMIFKTSRTARNGEQFNIIIRLDDQCKNGHNDFSITGDIYEAGKSKTERNILTSGAIGDEIGKQFPEFEIFNKLHLCDFNGIPMHGVSNGFYHLKNGFNSVKTTEKEEFKKMYCDYYRVTAQQFEILSTSETKDIFAYNLVTQGVFKSWKVEADKAIKQLQKLTGLEFKDDSKKTFNEPLTADKIKVIENDIKNGFYSAENIAVREQEKTEAKKVKAYADIKADFNKSVKKYTDEYKVKTWQLDNGIDLENSIFYNHTKQLCFNWKSYGDQHTAEQIEGYKTLLNSNEEMKAIISEITTK